MVRILRTGDNNVPSLDVPPQDDLGIGFSVLLSQFAKQRLLDQRFVSMAQRISGLDDDAFFLQELFQFFFLGVGMYLRLQHGGLYLADIQNLLNLLRCEV